MITKICGVKNKNTILCCEKNNINFYGMIFYKDSPRNINFEKAMELQLFSESLKIQGVGVFVNKSLDEVIHSIKELNLKFIQLHGDEDNNYINKVKEFNSKVIKKISIKDKHDLKDINKYSDADFYLFDYKPKKNELPGGNSKSFDWKIIKDFTSNKPWFLSGGINCKNIQIIKRNINPFGIDLSSGVEKGLGIKDNHIINNFMVKLNNA